VKKNCKLLLAFSLYCKGKRLLKTSRTFDEAAECFNSALAVCTDTGVDERKIKSVLKYRAYCYYLSGKDLLNKKKYDSAAEMFQQALVENGQHLCPESRKERAQYFLVVSELEQSLVPNIFDRLHALEDVVLGAPGTGTLVERFGCLEREFDAKPGALTMPGRLEALETMSGTPCSSPAFEDFKSGRAALLNGNIVYALGYFKKSLDSSVPTSPTFEKATRFVDKIAKQCENMPVAEGNCLSHAAGSFGLGNSNSSSLSDLFLLDMQSQSCSLKDSSKATAALVAVLDTNFPVDTSARRRLVNAFNQDVAHAVGIICGSSLIPDQIRLSGLRERWQHCGHIHV
jgi:hypothetical protein